MLGLEVFRIVSPLGRCKHRRHSPSVSSGATAEYDRSRQSHDSSVRSPTRRPSRAPPTPGFEPPSAPHPTASASEGRRSDRKGRVASAAHRLRDPAVSEEIDRAGRAMTEITLESEDSRRTARTNADSRNRGTRIRTRRLGDGKPSPRPAESPVARSSSATRRFCGRRSFHSQHAPPRPPKKTGRGSTHPRNCFPRHRCCTRTATAIVERPSPVVCPWQAMSPSDGQPVASDPASPAPTAFPQVGNSRFSVTRRGINPIGTGGEQTFRTPHRVVEPTSTTIRRRHTDLSEDRCNVSHSRSRRHLPEVPCLSAESDASIVTRWIASPAPSALRVSHPLSGLLPMHPRGCISSHIHS